MTILFKDTFQGSGLLAGRSPNVSVAPNVWDSNAYLGPGPTLTSNGLVGQNPNEARDFCYFYPQGQRGAPTELQQLSLGFKVTWEWTPLVASDNYFISGNYDAHYTADGIAFYIALGQAVPVGCQVSMGYVAHPDVGLQDISGTSLGGVSFAANTTYTGTIVVDRVAMTIALDFLGISTVVPLVFASGYSALDWSNIEVDVGNIFALKSLMIEDYPASAGGVWTGFRNAYEAS